MSDQIGTIHPKNTMFLREAAGEAKQPNGDSYELSLGMPHGLPLIRSRKTGLWFSVSWQEILTLAVEAGIDVETSSDSGASR